MFVVTVTFLTNPGDEGRFLDLVTQNAARSLSDEAGCHRFDVCTSADRPGEVFLYELYDDAAAFEVHKTTPHYLLFTEAAAPLVADKRVATYHLAGSPD